MNLKQSDKLLSEEFPSSARSNSSRSGSEAGQGARNESFLDNVNARSSFRRQKIQEERLMAEDEKFAKYRTKLKCISLFFVILSVFILLNASVGASSAPFYDKYTDCNRYDLTDDCKQLMKYTGALYGFEVTGSIILVVHGLLGMTAFEYIKKVWLIRFLSYYTKVAIFIYALDALLRTAMYWKIKNLVDPVAQENHDITNFAGYLAVYCENTVIGLVITGILLCVYGSCFAANCYLWRLTGQLHETALAVEEEKTATLERFNGVAAPETPELTANSRSVANRGSMRATEIEEETKGSYAGASEHKSKKS